MNEFLKRTSILEKKVVYQSGFFIVLCATVVLHLFFKIDPRLFLEGTFIVVCILLGIGFRHISFLYILMVTAILSFLVAYIGKMDFHGIDVLSYLFHWILYFLVASMIKLLIERFQKEQDETLSLVRTLSKALDARDPYTASHSDNVAKYAVLIAEKMGLSERECNNILTGALLHDIGKIGIPENILNKPGRLTDREFEWIKQHPKKGYDMVSHITKFKTSGLLDIILYHHERFDGKGYPFGLKAHRIPIAARIVSVADSFDAMTSKRVYRNQPLTVDYVLNEFEKGSGTQFDPEAAGALIELINEQRIELDTNVLWLAK